MTNNFGITLLANVMVEFGLEETKDHLMSAINQALDEISSQSGSKIVNIQIVFGSRKRRDNSVVVPITTNFELSSKIGIAELNADTSANMTQKIIEKIEEKLRNETFVESIIEEDIKISEQIKGGKIEKIILLKTFFR